MEFKKVSVLTSSYRDFKYKNSPKHVEYVSEELYKKILRLFITKLLERTIGKGKKVVLPSRIGAFQALRQRYTKKKVDFHTTNKVYGEHNKNNPDNKKVIYHRNRITNGYIPVYHWFKYNEANFKNKRKWKFKLARTNVRPNSYNKKNPTYSLIPFFQKIGYRFYDIYDPFNMRYINEQAKASKSGSA